MEKTIRMTVAQAIVKFLDSQYVSMDGWTRDKICGGVFHDFWTRDCGRLRRSAG